MAFSDEVIQRVWEKARASDGFDPGEVRQDECGAWLKRQAYGHDHSEYGWRIVNTALGEAPDTEALKPLHCKNVFDKAGGKVHCQVTDDRTGLQPSGHIDHPRNRPV